MTASLRSRLTAGLLLGTGLLLAGVGVVLYRSLAAQLRSHLDEELLVRARSLMSLTEDQDGKVWLELTDQVMPEFAPQHEPDYFELWLAGGPAVARAESLGRRDLPRLAVPADHPLLRDLTLPDGRRGRAVEVTFHPRPEIGEDVPDGPRDMAASSPLRATLVLAAGREELDAVLIALRLALLLAGGTLLVAIVLLVWGVVGVGLAPLDVLAQRLAGMDAASLAERLPAAGAPGELRPVIEHLNALLARLDASFARERAFSANLAHELRTPLAELRAVADVGLRWPEDHASGVAALEDARAIGLQMERVVGNLLALARYDGRLDTVERAPVALRELAEACWQPVATDAAARGMPLRLAIPAGLAVATDREKLALILNNLFANAVAHGVVGTPIDCAVRAGRGEVVLRLANAADDLLAADLPHLFDRFWRKDAARSGGRHAGLGLPLVAALCEQLAIDKEARLEGGTFVVALRIGGEVSVEPAAPGVAAAS